MTGRKSMVFTYCCRKYNIYIATATGTMERSDPVYKSPDTIMNQYNSVFSTDYFITNAFKSIKERTLSFFPIYSQMNLYISDATQN